MSNVSASEIAAMVARRFALSAPALAAKTPGRHRAQPAASRARGIALYLIQRHTTASWADCARMFDVAEKNSPRLKTHALVTERLLESDPKLADDVEAIENEIDALHEARTRARYRPGHFFEADAGAGAALRGLR
jgi:chromosomal replication initiation ATPase DnaA